MQLIGHRRRSAGASALFLLAIAADISPIAPAIAAWRLDCRVAPYTSGHCMGVGNRRCRALPPAPCFWVHGVFTAGGDGTLRLVPGGSHRILRVTAGDGDDERYDVPPAVQRLTLSGHEVRGDFLVCPFKVDRPGWMRPVCMAAASRVSAAR